MARFCPLYSGSSGNSTFVGDADGGVLVDVGVSCKSVVKGLDEIGQKPEQIKAIFITHEHSDHIKGLRVFLKNYPIPVFSSVGTLAYLANHDHVPSDAKMHVLPSGGVEVYGMQVTCFSTPHDAADSVGYRITSGERTMAVATDLGHVTEEVQEALIGCDLVMLESNYDVHMLDKGRYPYYLKKRIKGARGHLSNGDCAQKALDLVRNGTTRIFLAHLSNENNLPDLALQSTGAVLMENDMLPDKDYILRVAERYKPSKLMAF